MLWVGLLAGIAAAALGALIMFAGGMSDDVVAGEAYANRGCVLGIAGVLLFILCAILLAVGTV